MKDEVINNILTASPGVESKDVISTLDIIQQIQTEKQRNATSVEDWIPKPDTVRNVVNILIYPSDFEYSLNTFAERAKDKGFKIDSTLESKYIIHVKFLINSGKIEGRENNMGLEKQS